MAARVRSARIMANSKSCRLQQRNGSINCARALRPDRSIESVRRDFSCYWKWWNKALKTGIYCCLFIYMAYMPAQRRTVHSVECQRWPYRRIGCNSLEIAIGTVKVAAANKSFQIASVNVKRKRPAHLFEILHRNIFDYFCRYTVMCIT